jgi:hypothetical protein
MSELKPIGGGVQTTQTEAPKLVTQTQTTTVPPSLPIRVLEPDPTGPNKGVIAAVIAGVVLLGVLAFFVFRGGGPAEMPTNYTEFRAADGAFTASVPANWTLTPTGTAAENNGGLVESNGFRLRSGSAQVETTFSTVSALAGAQLLLGSDLTPGSMQGQSNAAAVAKMQRKGVKGRFANYEETKQPECPSSMGAMTLSDDKQLISDAVLYEFTASGTHGYRALMAGPSLIASALCQCSESDWPKLRPEFLKIIGGVKEIGRAGIGGRMDVPGAGTIPMPKGF